MGGSGFNMKVIFFGTPDYTLPILKALAKKYQIVAVVTQNPKPTGRKQQLTYSPIDSWAHQRKIPVIYDLEKVPQADLGILAAYGKIIPESVIKNLKFGILNIHPSLLPKFRGASPVQAAITSGETITGVTVIKLDSEMDHGPIISQFKENINPDDTTDSLRARLFERSAQFLIDLIPKSLNSKIKPKEQDHDKATFTKILTKQDGFVDLKKDSPEKIERMLRAYTPWPGVWTLVNQKRLKILKAHLENEQLILEEVQLEGKNPVSWQQFKEAYPTFSF
jgi:methionyl-tRNA formyltransferase